MKDIMGEEEKAANNYCIFSMCQPMTLIMFQTIQRAGNIYILQVKKVRLTRVNWLVKSQIADKQQSQDLNTGLWVPEPCYFLEHMKIVEESEGGFQGLQDFLFPIRCAL